MPLSSELGTVQSKNIYWKCEIEGIDVPISNITIMATVNNSAQISISIPPIKQVLDLKPRSIVNLYIGKQIIDSSGKPAVQYYSAFSGYYLSDSYVKDRSTRSFSIMCADFYTLLSLMFVIQLDTNPQSMTFLEAFSGILSSKALVSANAETVLENDFAENVTDKLSDLSGTTVDISANSIRSADGNYLNPAVEWGYDSNERVVLYSDQAVSKDKQLLVPDARNEYSKIGDYLYSGKILLGRPMDKVYVEYFGMMNGAMGNNVKYYKGKSPSLMTQYVKLQRDLNNILIKRHGGMYASEFKTCFYNNGVNSIKRVVFGTNNENIEVCPDAYVTDLSISSGWPVIENSSPGSVIIDSNHVGGVAGNTESNPYRFERIAPYLDTSIVIKDMIKYGFLEISNTLNKDKESSVWGLGTYVTVRILNPSGISATGDPIIQEFINTINSHDELSKVSISDVKNIDYGSKSVGASSVSSEFYSSSILNSVAPSKYNFMTFTVYIELKNWQSLKTSLFGKYIEYMTRSGKTSIMWGDQSLSTSSTGPITTASSNNGQQVTTSGTSYAPGSVVPFEDIVNKYAQIYGVDPKFVKAIIWQESKGGKYQVSRAGAVGLMQIMPNTWTGLSKELGLRGNIEDRSDPEQNIMVGTYYISKLFKKFGGDYGLVAAGYNGGDTYIQGLLDSHHVTSYDQVKPYITKNETRKYVPLVLNYMSQDIQLGSGVVGGVNNASIQMYAQSATAGNAILTDIKNSFNRAGNEGMAAVVKDLIIQFSNNNYIDKYQQFELFRTKLLDQIVGETSNISKLFDLEFAQTTLTSQLGIFTGWKVNVDQIFSYIFSKLYYSYVPALFPSIKANDQDVNVLGTGMIVPRIYFEEAPKCNKLSSTEYTRFSFDRHSLTDITRGVGICNNLTEFWDGKNLPSVLKTKFYAPQEFEDPANVDRIMPWEIFTGILPDWIDATDYYSAATQAELKNQAEQNYGTGFLKYANQDALEANLNIENKDINPFGIDFNTRKDLAGLYYPFWMRLMKACLAVRATYGFTYGTHYWFKCGVRYSGEGESRHKIAQAVDIHEVSNGVGVEESGGGDDWSSKTIRQYKNYNTNQMESLTSAQIITALGIAFVDPNINLRWGGYDKEPQGFGYDGYLKKFFVERNPKYSNRLGQVVGRVVGNDPEHVDNGAYGYGQAVTEAEVKGNTVADMLTKLGRNVEDIIKQNEQIVASVSTK
jgi:soluble lytic murein transglycosylase